MSAASVLSAQRMPNPAADVARVRILAILCGILLCILLTAGLWPFQAPRNRVTWARNGGVLFGKEGTVISSTGFPQPAPRESDSFSLEIWLQPSATQQEGTVLAFEGADGTRRFSIRQSNEDLVLLSGRERVFVDNVFARHNAQVVTLTESPQGVSIFVNGLLSRAPFPFPVSSRQLTGRLVLGTSVVQNDSWSGVVRGLAVYDPALTASEVARYAQAGPAGMQPLSGAGERRSQHLYPFDEAQGRIIRDTGERGISLEIPERFAILHQTFLERPWTEIHATWSYLKDFLINVGGFIPFGFVLSAYFAARRPGLRRMLLTVILGFATSLTIEVWQSFLPTRFSGMTDLVTNTFGTWVGAALYPRTYRAMITWIYKKVL